MGWMSAGICKPQPSNKGCGYKTGADAAAAILWRLATAPSPETELTVAVTWAQALDQATKLLREAKPLDAEHLTALERTR